MSERQFLSSIKSWLRMGCVVFFMEFISGCSRFKEGGRSDMKLCWAVSTSQQQITKYWRLDLLSPSMELVWLYGRSAHRFWRIVGNFPHWVDSPPTSPHTPLSGSWCVLMSMHMHSLCIVYGELGWNWKKMARKEVPQSVRFSAGGGVQSLFLQCPNVGGVNAKGSSLTCVPMCPLCPPSFLSP